MQTLPRTLRGLLARAAAEAGLVVRELLLQLDVPAPQRGWVRGQLRG